jgi:hypothetical protein
MSKPSKSSSKSPSKRTRRKAEQTPRFDALEELVIPVIHEHIPVDAEEPVMEITPLEDGRTHLCVVLHHCHAVKVLVDTFDQERAYLRLSLECGYLHGDYPSDVLLLGNFLDPTRFHIRADMKLGMFGQLTVGCDLLVCVDDEPVLRRTVDELLQLANDLDWFFQLRLPNRLHWLEAANMEIEWEELPH